MFLQHPQKDEAQDHHSLSRMAIGLENVQRVAAGKQLSRRRHFRRETPWSCPRAKSYLRATSAGTEEERGAGQSLGPQEPRLGLSGGKRTCRG